MKTKTPFLFSLCIALLVWLVWFGYTTPETAAIIQDNWQISLTMIFGSFIAGATSEGGGLLHSRYCDRRCCIGSIIAG